MSMHLQRILVTLSKVSIASCRVLPSLITAFIKRCRNSSSGSALNRASSYYSQLLLFQKMLPQNDCSTNQFVFKRGSTKTCILPTYHQLLWHDAVINILRIFLMARDFLQLCNRELTHGAFSLHVTYDSKSGLVLPMSFRYPLAQCLNGKLILQANSAMDLSPLFGRFRSFKHV